MSTDIKIEYDKLNSAEDADLWHVKQDGFEIGRIWENKKGYCEAVCVRSNPNFWISMPDKQSAIDWIVGLGKD